MGYINEWGKINREGRRGKWSWRRAHYEEKSELRVQLRTGNRLMWRMLITDLRENRVGLMNRIEPWNCHHVSEKFKSRGYYCKNVRRG